MASGSPSNARKFEDGCQNSLALVTDIEDIKEEMTLKRLCGTSISGLL
jgi:hypothetical protein